MGKVALVSTTVAVSIKRLTEELQRFTLSGVDTSQLKFFCLNCVKLILISSLKLWLVVYVRPANANNFSNG